MFFCDFDRKNESFESKGRVAKVYSKKKSMLAGMLLKKNVAENQVTGAGLNTASWLCSPH